MIKISPAAASIFKKDIDKEENKGYKLRIAVMKKEGNNFHYALGFDDNITSNDEALNVDGVEVIMSKASLEICSGMTVDYVEMEKGPLLEVLIISTFNS